MKGLKWQESKEHGKLLYMISSIHSTPSSKRVFDYTLYINKNT